MNQMILTINAYLALLVVLVNFVYAILVMVRTSRTTLYLIFLFICVSNIIWNFRDLVVFTTGNRYWYYSLLIGSTMLPPLMFHFVNALVISARKNAIWIALAYSFAAVLGLTPPFAYMHPGVREFVENGLWNVLYFILLGPFLLAGIIMLINELRRAKPGDERSRLRYILSAAIIGVSTGLTGPAQALKVPVPPLGPLGCLVYITILAISVLKHKKTYDILAEMRAKLQILSEMAAGIAHEIRNPLTSIKGASALMADELKKLGHLKCFEYHRVITEEIERLDHILANFQDLTRPLKLEKDSVSVNEVIQKTVKLAGVGALNLGIKLDLARDLPMVEGDASSMKQVFLNLIKNAAEACESDGELMIKTESVSPWVKISFSDNGPGISPELVHRIFEPFFTTKAAGMGVGLAISQRIVEAHHGRIEVNSLSPKGTQFSMFLPESA